MSESAACKYAAEFIGTYALVFTVGCNVLSGQPVWGGISIACVLTVMIYALGKVSGANFNPAVSLALGMAQKMPMGEAIKYMIFQLAGGILAGLSYSGLFGETTSLEPVGEHTTRAACFAEILYTFMLCFVVLNVAASKVHGGKNQFYGIAIGFVITAAAYSGGPVSSGCFNPAVAFGLDASNQFSNIKYCILYTLMEFVGAACAVGSMADCRPEEQSSEVRLGEDETPAYGLRNRLHAEFLGTFFLVLTVGLNVLAGSKAAVFSIASALMCMIFALGTVSGAHFNPAVTLAVLASGRDKICVKDAAAYMGTQILGAIFAAFTYTFIWDGKKFSLKPGGDAYEWHQIIIAEFFFTFVLAFVVLSVATVKNPLSQYFGFAIGMCVTCGGYAIGSISGGSLNPAVSIGISSRGTGNTTDCAIYVVTELVAGLVAAALFGLTQPSEYVTDKLAAGRSYGATSA